MQVWNVLHAARWKSRMQKIAKNLPSGHHRTTLSGCIFAIKAHIDNQKKNMLSSNISSTCLQNMADSSPLTAEIGSWVWGTPATFNGFRVLASLLQRRRSPEASQTLQDVWPSPQLLHYIHFPGLLPPNGLLPGAKFTLCRNVASPTFAALLHRTPASGVSETSNIAAWCKEWNYGTFAEGVTDIRMGSHHVGHRPTF